MMILLISETEGIPSMFHFQLTQSSQPRIAAVAGTAAGTFIEIFAALGAEPTAVRPAEGLHGQGQ